MGTDWNKIYPWQTPGMMPRLGQKPSSSASVCSLVQALASADTRAKPSRNLENALMMWEHLPRIVGQHSKQLVCQLLHSFQWMEPWSYRCGLKCWASVLVGGKKKTFLLFPSVDWTVWIYSPPKKRNWVRRYIWNNGAQKMSSCRPTSNLSIWNDPKIWGMC